MNHINDKVAVDAALEDLSVMTVSESEMSSNDIDLSSVSINGHSMG